MTDATGKIGKAPRRRGRKGKDGVDNEKASKDFNKAYDNFNADASSASSYKSHKTLLIHLTEETPTWFECGRGTATRDDTIKSVRRLSSSEKGKKHSKPPTNPIGLAAKYRKLADSIYHQEVTLYRYCSSSKDEAWVESTMKRGTLKDRIAAMSVVVSSHPVHKLYALDMLLNLAGVNSDGSHSGQTNERVSGMAAEALTDLFTSTLLPKNRKLVGLESRPLYLYEERTSSSTKKSISPRILLLWRYEEIIKNKYSAFLSQYLGKTMSQNATAGDNMTKVQALRTACSLLKEIPEGEQILLNMIVNKVGDPTRKIASSAGHELRMILETHPNMTQVIAREVQQLAHRPNLSTRALYNCIIFLNQLKLKKEEDPVEESSEGKGVELNNGNRKKISLAASLINTYFEIFEVAIKKSKQKDGKSKKTNAELDQAMKSRLLGALLTGVNRAHPYLPSSDTGMEEHIDSLYKISHVAPPSACTQAMMLLFHLAVGSNDERFQTPVEATAKDEEDRKSETSRKDRFYRALYSKLADPNMLFGKHLTMFFNVLFKAMKYDTDNTRVVAFGKRLIHVAFHYNPGVISGALFLLAEVMKHQPGLAKSVFTADGKMLKFDPSKREPTAAFIKVNKQDYEDESSSDEEAKEDLTMETNVNNSGNADESDSAGLWELSLTVHHYHPTVCKFTSDIDDVKYNGDPLRDFALAPFLDKFAFRNPKSADKIKKKFRRGESIGERRSGLQGGVEALKSLPMNHPDFWAKSKSNLPEQEEFFQKFFTERAKRDDFKGIVRNTQSKNDSDDEDVALDASELKDDGGKDFNWDDTDSEEEKFVQGLAEGLMKESGDKIEYDDEDPDMDDWSDIGSSDDDDYSDGGGEEGLNEGEGELKDFADMDGLEDDADAVMAEDSDDDDDDDAIANFSAPVDSDEGDDEDGFGLMFTGEGDEDEEDGSKEEVKEDDKKKKENKEPISSFASAEDFEERINAARSGSNATSRKRSNSEASIEEGGDDDEAKTDESPAPKKRKKKRSKKKKKSQSS
eukprot:CAMPEP_0194075016 /NCGR_PEP_ID=MMETSP0149-20130528/2065_1 /TAXON_ID=122233 /ORGANISM="Chaetoceros debilis, Strain MM31A-1" /LENGTH=1027 /DNA_ID=CAMNT_0038755353 /DNA_START=24 /DNA_END=3107 /DNA_ORIENTATION=+